jgi:hypothetical protein
MKTLIAVMCCHSRIAYSDASRQTWAKDVQGADYKVFYGDGSHGVLNPDEIQLAAPDDYYHTLTKIYEIVKWAYEQGYDYVLKCDDDVYVLPDRLMTSPFMQHDFVGGEPFGVDGDRIFRYQNAVLAPGGVWWMSRKAMAAVLSFPQPKQNDDELFVAHALKTHGLKVHIDNRIGGYGSIPSGSYELVHCQLPDASSVIAEYEFTPEQMQNNHMQWKTGTRSFPSEKKVDRAKVDVVVGSCHFKNPA